MWKRVQALQVKTHGCALSPHGGRGKELTRNTVHAAFRHGQEERNFLGAPEAKVSPPCFSHHKPPGETSRAGQHPEHAYSPAFTKILF